MLDILLLKKHHSSMKDPRGICRTLSLFHGLVKDSEYPSYFTVAEVKELYLSYDHIPGFEYEFAFDLLGSWDHWVVLSENSTLRHEIAKWRDELEIKLKAKAMRELIAASKGNTPTALQAAKYISDRGYSSKRGRPSKAEVERQRKIEAGVRENLEEDMARLGLSIVNGNNS